MLTLATTITLVDWVRPGTGGPLVALVATVKLLGTWESQKPQ